MYIFFDKILPQNTTQFGKAYNNQDNFEQFKIITQYHARSQLYKRVKVVIMKGFFNKRATVLSLGAGT